MIKGLYSKVEALIKIKELLESIENSSEDKFYLNLKVSNTEEIENNVELELKEAAQIIGHSDTKTLASALKKGIFTQIEFRMIGKTYLITMSAVNRYIREYKGKSGFGKKNLDERLMEKGKVRKKKKEPLVCSSETCNVCDGCDYEEDKKNNPPAE